LVSSPYGQLRLAGLPNLVDSLAGDAKESGDLTIGLPMLSTNHRDDFVEGHFRLLDDIHG